MNNPNPEKALQHPDYTLYPKLCSAVNDHTKLLQAINHFSRIPSILSISPLNQVLEN